MSPLVWCLARLLAVLWAVGQSAASQPQRSAGVSTALGPDQLLRLIVQDVTANIQPLITKLGSRIDQLDARLIPRLNGIETRLNSIETRLNALDFKQDSFDARLDNFGAKLDSLTSHVDSESNRLDARLDELVSRVDGPAERNDRLQNISSRLESISSRVDGVSSRLEDLANLTDQLAQPPPPRDCSELPAGSRSGIHLLQLDLDRSRPPVKAYCDLESDGGRWTVIQRRADVQPRQSFNLSWSEYREGFGDLEAEFWWGLENLWKLTGPQHRQYQLRVSLADFDGGRRHATYGLFRVASGANGYQLTVSDYTGDAGDSLGGHNGLRFSTYDREQDTDDKRHCAQLYGGGWWYYHCYSCHLNGPYLSGQQEKRGGINWYKWKGYDYSLKETEMKLRPVDTD